MLERFKQLLGEMNRGIYEKVTEKGFEIDLPKCSVVVVTMR